MYTIEENVYYIHYRYYKTFNPSTYLLIFISIPHES